MAPLTSRSQLPSQVRARSQSRASLPPPYSYAVPSAGTSITSGSVGRDQPRSAASSRRSSMSCGSTNSVDATNSSSLGRPPSPRSQSQPPRPRTPELVTSPAPPASAAPEPEPITLATPSPPANAPAYEPQVRASTTFEEAGSRRGRSPSPSPSPLSSEPSPVLVRIPTRAPRPASVSSSPSPTPSQFSLADMVPPLIITKKRASLPEKPNKIATNIKRWDGCNRASHPWEDLKRDPELTVRGADCAVFLHAKGKSRRLPSMLVPLSHIQASGCLPLLCSATPGSGLELALHDNDFVDGTAAHSLYLPAPGPAHGQDARNWHLTTRNVFAWIMNKPLVGRSLTQALLDLVDRLHTLRPASMDSVRDVVAYAGRMGYTDMVNCPNHSLAMLTFAEHFHITFLWKDAFVHCAGQNEVLYLSPEYQHVSKKTQASLTRAFLRMDLRLINVSRVLGNFLEGETNAAKLGLTTSQRSHLDRFRSFLHSHYVAKLGYWPPVDYSRDLLEDMHHELLCLYDLLADKSSVGNRAASGGLCTLQTCSAYDRQHEYIPRGNLTPLLPRDGHLSGKALQIKQFRLSKHKKEKRRNLLLTLWANLLQATNKLDHTSERSSLVKSYRIFEEESLLSLEADLTVSDARKVRWIMVYYLLQTLSAVMPSPFVSDYERADYHTCALVPEVNWTDSSRLSFMALTTSAAAQSTETVQSPSAATESSSSDEIATPVDPSPPLHTLISNEPIPSAWSVRPDCENDDYFAPKRLSPRDSMGPTKDSVKLLKKNNSVHISPAEGAVLTKRTSVRLVKKNSLRAMSTDAADLPAQAPVVGRTHSMQITRRNSLSGRMVLRRRASSVTLDVNHSHSKRLSSLWTSTINRQPSISRDDLRIPKEQDTRPDLLFDPLRQHPRTSIAKAPLEAAATFGPFELDATETSCVPFHFDDSDHVSVADSVTPDKHYVSTPELFKSDDDHDSLSDYNDVSYTNSDGSRSSKEVDDSPLRHKMAGNLLSRPKSQGHASILTCETEWSNMLGGDGRTPPLNSNDVRSSQTPKAHDYAREDSHSPVSRTGSTADFAASATAYDGCVSPDEERAGKSFNADYFGGSWVDPRVGVAA